jgi:hypothetical protein
MRTFVRFLASAGVVVSGVLLVVAGCSVLLLERWNFEPQEFQTGATEIQTPLDAQPAVNWDKVQKGMEAATAQANADRARRFEEHLVKFDRVFGVQARPAAIAWATGRVVAIGYTAENPAPEDLAMAAISAAYWRIDPTKFGPDVDGERLLLQKVAEVAARPPAGVAPLAEIVRATAGQEELVPNGGRYAQGFGFVVWGCLLILSGILLVAVRPKVRQKAPRPLSARTSPAIAHPPAQASPPLFGSSRPLTLELDHEPQPPHGIRDPAQASPHGGRSENKRNFNNEGGFGMMTDKTVSVILLIVAIVLMFIGGVLLFGGCVGVVSELDRPSEYAHVGPGLGSLLAGFVLVGGGIGALVLRHRFVAPTRGEEPKANKGP